MSGVDFEEGDRVAFLRMSPTDEIGMCSHNGMNVVPALMVFHTPPVAPVT